MVREELSSLSPLAVIVLQEDDVEVILEEGKEGHVVKEEEVVEEDDTSNVEIEHIQSTIICHSCGAEFAEETELEKHSSNCSTSLEFECAFCSASFLSELGLRAHVRIHSDGSTCEKCGKRFRHVSNLEIHQKEECGKEPTLKCPLCNSKFHFKPQLNAHLIDCHSEAKLVSPQQELSSQSHSSDEQYQCKLCPRSFTRAGSLNYHVSRKHSGDEKRSADEFPYLCPDCGNRYKSSTQLCRHRRWECGKEAMFQCQLCVKKFHHRHGLKQHMKLHLAKNGQVTTKPFTSAQFYCEKCGRGYKLRSSLNNHIKWECGKEPVFPCSVCHVRFAHKGNLKKHILTKHVAKTPPAGVKQEE